jgi:hypothetical protein
MCLIKHLVCRCSSHDNEQTQSHTSSKVTSLPGWSGLKGQHDHAWHSGHDALAQLENFEEKACETRHTAFLATAAAPT